jgi:2-keto-3-deoxy-6-phosphogluconate aldolase
MDRKRSFVSGRILGSLCLLALALTMSSLLGLFARPTRIRQTGSAERNPAIQTSKTAYLAGETVTVTGEGFTPLESVMLRVSHNNGTQEAGMGHDPWWVYADASGKFTTQWSINANDTAGIALAIAADGSSGSSAKAEFGRTAMASTNLLSRQRGEPVRIKATGFKPNELVNLQVNGGTPVATMSDENGEVIASAVPSDNFRPNSFRILATAAESGVTADLVPSNPNWFIFTDQQGADDISSNQSDMNLMGRLDDVAAIKKFVAAWDSTNSWTGSGQTGDICFLFDKNNNKNIDYAVCVRVTNFNQSPTDVRVVPSDTNKPVFLFNCDDKSVDKCSQSGGIKGNPIPYNVNDVVTGSFENTFLNDDTTTSNMDASQTINDNLINAGSDPFTGCATGQTPPCAGPSTHPDHDDTVIEVHIKSSILPDLVGSTTGQKAVLANVCSYPSAGSGGNNSPFDCVITPGNGQLVIHKNAGTDTSTPFVFSVGPPAPSAPQPATYTVTGGSSSTQIGIQVTTSLSIAETVPQGWSFTSATCSIEGTNDPVTTSGSAVNGIEIQSGKVTTCTVVNTPQPARLTLVKVVTNNSGGTKTLSDFPLSAAGTTPITNAVSGTSAATNVAVTAGTYTLSEVTQSGYTASGFTCSGGNGTSPITLGLGQSATCTISNDDQPAHLKLVKIVTNDNGGTKTLSDFKLSAAGPTPIVNATSGTSAADTNVNAGTYTLSEQTSTGYTSTGFTCVGGNNQSPIRLGSGESATCTITNNDQAATLTLVKIVTNDNGGSKTLSDFPLSAAGPTPINNVVSGTTQANNVSVTAGTYTISEQTQSGYTTVSNDCVGGNNQSPVTLAVGESATCTITNNDQQAHLTLVKVVTNNNGGTKTVSNFPLSAAGPTPITNVISGTGAANNVAVDAGTYTISEQTQSGYTIASNVCVGGDDHSPVTLGSGQSATCTITNDDVAASPTAKTYESWRLYDRMELTGYVDVASAANRGSITFKLWDNANCVDGAQIYTEVVTGANMTLSSGTLTAATTGTGTGSNVVTDASKKYYWRAFFAGDQNNNATNTGCGDEITEIHVKDGAHDPGNITP